MLIPFMTAYWASFGVLAGVMIITWVVAGVMSDGSASKRAFRNAVRLALVLTGLALIAVLLGIWLPAFIPGLY